MNFLFRFASLLCVSASLVGPAQAGVEAVWIEDDGRKVSRESAPRLLALESPLKLFGMRNETVAFQVLVHADAEGAEEVLPTLSPMGEVEISIFREDYLQVTERSHDLVWKPGSAAEPAHQVGWLPDRLVPLQSGVSIAGGQNQAFWIDLWIPPEAAAGTYQGTLKLQARGGCEAGCEIAIELEVIDLLMPERSHARTMLWFSGGEAAERYVHTRYFADPGRASEEEKRALRLAHYQLAKKHRVTLFAGNHEAPNEELGDLLSGRAFTEELGYRGPGQNLGQNILVLHAYGGELTAEEAKTWLAYSDKFKHLVDRFVYVMDEPPEEERDEVNRRARVSQPMPAFVTSIFDPKIEAEIFAAPAGLYNRANARASAEAGKKLWIYNGVRPFTGTFAIDDVAVSPRVNPWIQYKLGIERWFYWEATYYFDFQGKRGAVDVAVDPINFTNRHGDRVNGDGLLFYPGRDFLFPESDVGIDAPLPSIRLKNWRRGIEDVEYLVMARQAGFDKEVDELLETLLPRVVDQVNASSALSWPTDGKRWLEARRYLFELLRDGKTGIVPKAAPPAQKSPRKSLWPWMMFLGFFAAMVSALVFRRR